MASMDGFTEKILDVALGAVIFFALITVILTATNGIAWSAVNVGGTNYNLAWFPYVLVLCIVVGCVVLIYRHMLKKGK